MPRDVDGSYTLPVNQVSPAVDRTIISSVDFNALTADIETALNGTPASQEQTSTDNAVVRFNGATGGTQDSGVTIDDSDNIVIPGSITAPTYSTPGTLGNNAAGAIMSGGYVTPQMYGAAGDGSTDDTTALSNCLNSGKPVLLIGKFKITAPVVVGLNYTSGPFGLCIAGAGQMLSQIILTNATDNLTINLTYATISANTQVILKDFSVIATAASTGVNGTSGMINLIGSVAPGVVAQNCSLSNVQCIADGGSGSIVTALYLQDIRHSNIDSFMTRGNFGVGSSSAIVFTSTDNGAAGNAPVEVMFTKCFITEYDKGIWLKPSGNTNPAYTNDWQGIHIVDCSIVLCNYCIYADGDGETNATGLWVRGCSAAFAVNFIYHNSVQVVQVLGNYIQTIADSTTAIEGHIGPTGVVCMANYIGNMFYAAANSGCEAVNISSTGSGVIQAVATGNTSIGPGATTLAYTGCTTGTNV